MIVFDLECVNGHTFEGWFEDRADLDRQQEDGLLQCPVCESFSVSPKLSAVAVRTSSSPSLRQAQQAFHANQEVLAEFTERVADFVEKHYEDVGGSFAKEALKMHYGAKEFRNIRGTTTQEEEKTLEKEGVQVFKVPVKKKENEDLN
ncbi:MAG TPA: DUF1178 domain-containing protein [Desulfobacteraceae bacterium]|nr:DUF1178 domain-containing protein [Desulfobacteraceae bacterium]|tara:strand:+ start:559 stop:999 length:441 start_codon:yes stop_codon:yes gene_type:complete